MNYAEIKWTDIANGPGVRISLFVSGCRNRCPGCFNQKAQRFDCGRPYTPDTEKGILDALWCAFYSGISLLGGDPFEPENERELIPLAKTVRELGKTVWCWTGYRMEELKGRPLLEHIDVLVDGPFVRELKSPGLLWRGSSNQRIWKREGNGWIIMPQ